ncbi:PilT protein domain-containing protein [Thioploca ingrica]|uniref:Ribonuclease VapC n=1 Tax=Thioploca ingrica TaxID=40754 RepID=A0A090AIU4_9GAMM|nr:PilT protein domain-containing protein [Thioploca ingrica]
MILVDTSVWIDFLHGKETPQVTQLEFLLGEREKVSLCGVILTEILQGIRDNRQYTETLYKLNTLNFLEMSQTVFVTAAEIYRELRKKGITIRKSVDCMIAAVALVNNCSLLHNDRDFEAIATSFPLILLN